ncbi:class I SAM-dependent methyltransferase [Actinomadura sp. 6N118]|uniref:class I SAM-dependent methyltransferase n=1 Tax=Actinomadura sp. 6N118 TaxID=3375151 RepID=UPI00378E22BE
MPNWMRSRTADSLHEHTPSSETDELREEILRLADPRPDDQCIDLGAGAGHLTRRLAERTERVFAVEATAAISEISALGLNNVVTYPKDLMALALPFECTDLAVSGYAFHHVHNADKRVLTARIRRWLRPGGRLVIGDLMYSSGSFSLGSLFRPGSLPRGGQTAPPEFWVEALRDASFEDVEYVAVSAKTGIVYGHA